MMPGAFAMLPAVLVAVFLAGGASKLGRLQLVSTALRDFRLPALLANPIVAALLPVVELLLGLALLFTHGWVFTVVAACAVLATGAFVLIVARALSRGDQFDCHCFGATIRSPIGGALLARNLLLLAAAVGSTALGVTGFDGVVPAVTRFTSSDLAWAAISILLAGLAVTTFRTSPDPSVPVAVTSESSAPPHPVLAPGDSIPDMHLDTLSGASSRILDSIGNRPHLLVFAKPGCRSCLVLLQQSPEITRELGPSTGMLLLVPGDSGAFEAEHPRLAPFALYGAGALAVRLGISSYPAAALLSPDGTILAAPAIGGEAIHALASGAEGLAAARAS